MSHDDLQEEPLHDKKRKKYGGTQCDDLDPVTLTWHRINVFTKQSRQTCPSLFSKKQIESGTKRQILNEVSGIVRPGELLAIMGASGAGKTTLMNVLTSQGGKGLRVRGGVRVNGRNLGKDIKYISAYVQQDDLFVSTLTVREHLNFQAQLRIDEAVPDIVRHQRVDDVMTELGMLDLADERIGSPGHSKALSGGERKRLSFASEVMTNPALMFCDEPTSGLDSFMAQTVVETLRNMASRGRTILCTIHQPSSAVYALMDKVCFLAEGRVAFIGSTERALRFFDSIGRTCPFDHNPADFLIHTLAVIPGEEAECRARIKQVCDIYELSGNYAEMIRAIEAANTMETSGSTEVTDSTGSHASENHLFENSVECKDEIPEPELRYKSSWCKQFRLLFWRSWTDNARNPAINRTRLIQVIMMSVIVGAMYWNQVINQKGVQNINGALFFMEIQITFSNYFLVVGSFPNEYPLFKREHVNGMYRVDPYYLSHVLAELPMFILIPIVMSAISYFMIGLYLDVATFFIFAMAFILMSLATVAFGHLISTATVDMQFAVAAGPIFINPILFFGGYFLNAATIPWYCKPLEWVSWFYYVTEILVINQWRNVDDIACEYARPVYTLYNGTGMELQRWDTSMCYPTGNAVIDSYGFGQTSLWKDIAGLLILTSLFEISAFLLLLVRSKMRES